MRVIVGQPPWPGHGGTIVIGDLSEHELHLLWKCCGTLSTCTVQRKLEALHRKGLIVMPARTQARGLRLTDRGAAILRERYESTSWNTGAR